MTSPYSVLRDPRSEILWCRIDGALSDGDAAHLAADLAEAIAQSRAKSPHFRLVFDNRDCIFPSAEGHQAMASMLAPLSRPGDRVAIIVSSSVLKARARGGATEAQVFMSESAALTWLNAYA